MIQHANHFDTFSKSSWFQTIFTSNVYVVHTSLNSLYKTEKMNTVAEFEAEFLDKRNWWIEPCKIYIDRQQIYFMKTSSSFFWKYQKLNLIQNSKLTKWEKMFLIKYLYPYFCVLSKRNSIKYILEWSKTMTNKLYWHPDMSII